MQPQEGGREGGREEEEEEEEKVDPLIVGKALNVPPLDLSISLDAEETHKERLHLQKLRNSNQEVTTLLSKCSRHIFYIWGEKIDKVFFFWGGRGLLESLQQLPVPDEWERIQHNSTGEILANIPDTCRNGISPAPD